MQQPRPQRNNNFDHWLLFSVVAILSLGFVMLASASTPVAERLKVNMLHLAWHQAVFIFIGLTAGLTVTFIPIKVLAKYSNAMLFASAILLTIVLIPGVTHPVNGSMRWLFVGPISIQPSELAKLALVFYIAGYMVRRNYQLLNTLQGFLIPMFVLAIAAFLLMLEPDFGAVVVIACTTLGMLFLGGVRVKNFLILLPVVLCVLGFLAVSSSYRVQRFVAFRDPWADQYNTGYQLVQSLIAFGRGSWFGSGLGSSIQKLLYLPESHSDFIFAVLAEELGLVGVLCVLALYGMLAFRAMEIGRKAKTAGLEYAGNLAYGIGLLLMLQTLINVCVNVGLMPTKGLTLPLMSAGGSSMVAACIAIGVLFRVDYETRISAAKH
ncbi:MAG TPA: putative lipid II flippase FtsW [Gammaproteobacteria bacterium]|nr:putative lipid II flippase FtsW [Gammaproteobacteria bacterium]